VEIKTQTYNITYNKESSTIQCAGSLRLSGMAEYAPVIELFNQAVEDEAPQLILNLRKLDILNSSGINVLSKFVIRIRQKKKIQLIVQGASNIPWQTKSLKNLQRLMPTIKLEWD